jgi:Phosphoglucomutase/phosphomannomutase, alpha/beta/alpha domain III
MKGSNLWNASLVRNQDIAPGKQHSHRSSLGFKYIGNVASRLVQDNFDVRFGYEEAIGFMVETGIRDKDGIAAAVRTLRISPICHPSHSLKLCMPNSHPQVAFVELVAALYPRGASAFTYLEELYAKLALANTR